METHPIKVRYYVFSCHKFIYEAYYTALTKKCFHFIKI